METFYVPPRWLFVRVETEDGASGWGEASLEGHAEAVAGAYEALRDRFVGQDASRIEDIWQVAYRSGFYRGGPVLMSALSGLDQARFEDIVLQPPAGDGGLRIRFGLALQGLQLGDMSPSLGGSALR